MDRKFDNLTEMAACLGTEFDAVIDVRAPAEFAEDHVPGAISMPVLSDEERAVVGTIYTQESPFKARKIGGALVARNAAHHLETQMAEMPGSWRPLVYCWRGGQRSHSFASILSQVGWRVAVVEGGYKTWRRLVVGAMHDRPLPHRLILLDGNTGTAKTDILQRLSAHGVQTVDLEGLAAHRGSVLGGMPGGQPSQKAFEGALAVAFEGLDPARPVVVEAESAKIGDLMVPPSVWAAMRGAPRIEVQADLEARAAYLVRTYDGVISQPGWLEEQLASLVGLQGHEVVDGWIAQARAGAFADLARDLMQRHYDPRYAKWRGRAEVARLGQVGLTDMSGADLDRAAADVAKIVGAARITPEQ